MIAAGHDAGPRCRDAPARLRLPRRRIRRRRHRWSPPRRSCSRRSSAWSSIALGGDAETLAASRSLCDPGRRWSRPRCCSRASPRSRSCVGVGTAWVVTTFEFPGPRHARSGCCRCRSRSRPTSSPMSMSTCSTRSGRCRSALRALFGWRVRRRLLVPERALARRRHLRHGLRALSLRLSRRARDVPDPERALFAEAARMLGARPWPLARAHHAAAGAAGDRGRRSRSRCSRRSTTSAPANISACRR